MMLLIAASVLHGIVAHALADHPRMEACGLVVHRPGTSALADPRGVATQRHIRMRNSLQSPLVYEFDPEEYLALWRTMETAGEEPLVFYHSHPTGPARPSHHDRRCRAWPGAHYLIVSTANPAEPEVRSYTFVGAELVGEPHRAV